MSAEPDNLTLVFLRRIDAGLQDIRVVLQDHGQRLTRIEGQLGGLVRDRGDDIEARSHLQAQIDRMRGELDRIKRRLDIVE